MMIATVTLAQQHNIQASGVRYAVMPANPLFGRMAFNYMGFGV